MRLFTIHGLHTNCINITVVVVILLLKERKNVNENLN